MEFFFSKISAFFANVAIKDVLGLDVDPLPFAGHSGIQVNGLH